MIFIKHLLRANDFLSISYFLILLILTITLLQMNTLRLVPHQETMSS